MYYLVFEIWDVSPYINSSWYCKETGSFLNGSNTGFKKVADWDNLCDECKLESNIPVSITDMTFYAAFSFSLEYTFQSLMNSKKFWNQKSSFCNKRSSISSEKRFILLFNKSTMINLIYFEGLLISLISIIFLVITTKSKVILYM